MTVGELIKVLEQYNKEAEVYIHVADGMLDSFDENYICRATLEYEDLDTQCIVVPGDVIFG